MCWVANGGGCGCTTKWDVAPCTTQYRRLQSLADDVIDNVSSTVRRLQSLTDDVIDTVSSTVQVCWANTNPVHQAIRVGNSQFGGKMPWDVDSLVVPVPGYGQNWNTNTTLGACRELCDRTIDCNHIAFVPAVPSTNRAPGCYMYAAEYPGEDLDSSAPIATELSIDSISDSNAWFQTRWCPNSDFGYLAEALTNYGMQPSVAFGSATDNADIKIAFLDNDAYADVVTVSGRDHVRIDEVLQAPK